MSESRQAVFLSYASQDAEAARRIAEALRAAGVEVWFDQNELVGGDAWDAKIRGQIATCELFIPIISANTQSRLEGYFRLEWKLAAQRTHTMADEKAFLLPVVIDDTRDNGAKVPGEFRAVQWTRLPGGQTPDKFCQHVRGLLESGTGVSPVSSEPGRDVRAASSHRAYGHGARAIRRGPRLWIGVLAVGLALAAGFAVWQPSKKPAAVSASLSEARQLVAKVYAAKVESADATRATFDAVDRLCERAAAIDPTDAEVWAAWAYVDAWRIQQFERTAGDRRESARRRAAQAMTYAPQSFHARLAQAAYLVHVAPDQRTERAETILGQLLAEQPEHPGVLRLLVQLLRRARRHEETYPLLDRLQRVPGYAATAHSVRGWGFRNAGRFADAKAEAEKSLAAGGGWSAVALKTQMCLQWDGDLDAAKACVDQMPPELLLEDDGAFLAFTVFEWRREPEQGLRVLRALNRDWLSANGYNGPKALLVGQAYLAANRPDAARTEFQLALKLVNERLTATPGDLPLLARKITIQEHLGDATGLAETRRLRAQVNGNAALAQAPTVASRLALLAEPAGDRARKTAASLRLDPENDDLRAEPAFQALLARAEGDALLSPRAMSSAAAPAPEKSVAVLAFRQLSGDPENEYLCEAISDELCSVLGRLPGLKVAASASAFTFKGNKRGRLADMARQLGVAYLVDGSVQKIGNRVRVRAELIKAADESAVWKSDTLEHEAKDMFAVQDEVVAAIAKNLQVQLGNRPMAPFAINPEAFRLYYEGRRAWSMRGDKEYSEQAKQLFRRAIAADAKLGRAYSGLADTLINDSPLTFADRDSERAREIRSLTESALRLEPESAEAYTTRGALGWQTWRFREAEQDLRNAIRLNPSYAHAHLILGRVLAADGRTAEALAELKLACEFDPLSSRTFDNYAGTLREAGRFSEALAQAERAVALQPNNNQALRTKMQALSHLGRHDEAVALARGQAALSPTGVPGVTVLVRAGRTQEAARLFEKLKDERRGNTMPTQLAVLGQREEALQALDAQEAAVITITGLYFNEAFDPLRSEPRFVRYLTTLGVKESHDRVQAWRAAHPPEKSTAKK